MRFLITGGAGFIGSAVARTLAGQHGAELLVVDKLTYAGNRDSLASVAGLANFRFLQADIGDFTAMRRAMAEFQPDVVMNLAAESHVDRSIEGPGAFIQTNMVGTFHLLQAALDYWRALPVGGRAAFRFHHVSTDEVFGSLGPDGLFLEDTAYAPNSPYSASKAASDHLVRAWGHTYGLPVLITNCSNNYGPYHFPEKLIPLMIIKALEGEKLPVYGKGENVRDWLYVDDHADALISVAQRGRCGESYNVGGRNERTNLAVVQRICALLDELAPRTAGPYAQLISYVADRPGHDLRYAIDATKIERELGWKAKHNFDTGLRATVIWYLNNRSWWERVRSGAYRGERLGLTT